MITVEDIMVAMAACELNDWGIAVLPDFPALTAFPFFPDEQEHQNTKYPYSGHQVEESGAVTEGLNHLGSIEQEQWHRIVVHIVFGKEGMSLDRHSLLDARWRTRYLTHFPMHHRWGMSVDGVYGIQSSVMGNIFPLGLDLHNRKDVGIGVPVTVTIRQPMQSAD